MEGGNWGKLEGRGKTGVGLGIDYRKKKSYIVSTQTLVLYAT